VDLADVFKQAFVTEKDSKRFPESGGWGYAVFSYDAALEHSSRPIPKTLQTAETRATRR
jgi:hypothetical protein